MFKKFSEFFIIKIKGMRNRICYFLFMNLFQFGDLLLIFLLDKLKFSPETKKAVFDELLLMRYEGKFNYPSNPKGYKKYQQTSKKTAPQGIG